MNKILIVGGAGFIGSNLIRALLNSKLNSSRVCVLDNLSVGTQKNLQRMDVVEDIEFIMGDIRNEHDLQRAMAGASIVVHLAANADISASQNDPLRDHRDGTDLASRVFVKAIENEVDLVVYASGSGVYGRVGRQPVSENYSPLMPISTYGASKLAAEAMLSAYSNMFGLNSVSFRFANVVGQNQTHGVTYDFARKLKSNSSELVVLGDGSQTKMYIDVQDVCRAIILTLEREFRGNHIFNLGGRDLISVKQIAEISVKLFGRSDASIRYGTTPDGWKGDVSFVNLDDQKFRQYGWIPTKSGIQVVTDGLKFAFDEID